VFLHLLNNYTGDTMSFNMGREMAEQTASKFAR
jgi:dihydroxyacetone kinase